MLLHCSSMPSPILLPAGSNLAVKVHPVVLFSICDAYTRRRENQERVIGTLLGVVVDNVMEIKHCFTVPHTENAETVRRDVDDACPHTRATPPYKAGCCYCRAPP